MTVERISPNVHDRETHGFFDAAAEGRLVYRVCEDCQRAIHPPTEHCPRCGSWNTAWKTATGRGRLHAWTTVSHQIHPAYPAPFTVVVVELEDTPDVRLLGRLDGAPDLAMGEPMDVWFEQMVDGATMPQWRRAGA